MGVMTPKDYHVAHQSVALPENSWCLGEVLSDVLGDPVLVAYLGILRHLILFFGWNWFFWSNNGTCVNDVLWGSKGGGAMVMVPGPLPLVENPCFVSWISLGAVFILVVLCSYCQYVSQNVCHLGLPLFSTCHSY